MHVHYVTESADVKDDLDKFPKYGKRCLCVLDKPELGLNEEEMSKNITQGKRLIVIEKGHINSCSTRSDFLKKASKCSRTMDAVVGSCCCWETLP